MRAITTGELIPLLQTAIGPVILISGLGLLLLTMTNRLARTVDLSRELVEQYGALQAEARIKIDREIAILWKRAGYVRLAIMLAVSSVLGAALLVILLFLLSFFGIEAPILISVVFILTMLGLIFSLLFFLLDVNLTLSALRIELESHRNR